MANRTIQTMGFSYSETPISITASLNNNVVYSGEIFTSSNPIPALPDLSETNQEYLLFSFEIPSETSGTLPFSITVNNGEIMLGMVLSNYMSMRNPIYTTEQIEFLNNSSNPWSEKMAIYTANAQPPFSAEELEILNDPNVAFIPVKNDIIEAHNASTMISSGPTQFLPVTPGDMRDNVFINGQPQSATHDDPYEGPWWWGVNSGSTLTCDLTLDPTY